MSSGLQSLLLAFLFGAILAGLECLTLLESTGLSSISPGWEIFEVQWRYGLTFILLLPFAIWLAKRLGLSAQTPLQKSAWVFVGLSYLIGNWWVHSELLRNVSKWEPISLAWWIGTAVAAIILHKLLRGLENRQPLRILGVIAFCLPLLGQWNYRMMHPTEASEVETDPSMPDITLVVIDTLRADHLGCYGYRRADGEETSPFLDKLSQKGVLFEDCWAQAPWTRPSMASLHSGLFCSSHQVNATYSRLPAEALTLAEILHSKGYRTGAFSANDNVSPVFGFQQGFEHFWNTGTRKLISFTTWGDWKHKLFNKSLRKSLYDGGDWAALVNQQVFDWHKLETSRPTFTYIQYIDPHTPYDPPQGGYAFDGERPDLTPVLEIAKTFRHTRAFPFGARATIKEELLQRAIKLYDAEIRYVDSQVQALVGHLESIGKLDQNDWLFIVSDHGEEFQEHHQWGHGQSLFEEQLHVPLIVMGPKAQAGLRVSEPVNVLDIHATIAGIAEVMLPDSSPSVPLQPLLAGLAMPGVRTLFAERLQEGRELQAIRKGSKKLISLPDFENVGKRFHLYFDLKVDPAETIGASAPDWRNGELLKRKDAAFMAPVSLLNKMLAMMESTISTALSEETAEANEDIRRKLAEMGYIGEDGELKLGN